MPVARLTDLSVSKLKSEKQTRFWDAAFPAFGILVGKRRKTFIVMTGRARQLKTLGRYPSVTLQNARRAALVLLGNLSTIVPADARESVAEYIRQLDAGERWKLEQERLLTKHMLPKVKDLATVSKKDIVAITDGLLDTPSEQLHAHRAMKAFFNWCQARDYVTASPLTGLPLPNTPKDRERILMPDELRKVWQGAADLEVYGPVLRTCILLGTRRGETSAIVPEWIQGGTLVIPGTHTKNGLELILPLSKAAMYYVQKVANGPRPNWNSWNKIKKNFDKAAGLSNYTVHDIRRTFRTLLGQIGIEPHIGERLVNHISEQTEVQRIYDRYKYLKEKAEALRKYERHLETIIREKLI